MSNTTTQTILQIQIAGCLVDCQNLTLAQTATQQNTTVQVIGAAAPLAAGPGLTTGSESAPQTPGRVVQVQVGCLAECSGSTTVEAVAGFSIRALTQLLALLVPPDQVGQTPVPATEQNVVDQTTCQSQTGAPEVAGQSQSATETSSTTQIVALTPAAIASLEVAFGLSQVPGIDTVNQTEQIIVQVQLGCLFQCSGTEQ